MDIKNQENIIEFLVNFIKKNKLKLFIKPHPGENNFEYFKNKFEIKSKVKFIMPRVISMNLVKKINEDNFFDFELSKFIQQSKIVINFHSTTTIDALFYLTPVINLNLNKNESWVYKFPYMKYLLKLGATSIVYNFKELNRDLLMYLKSSKYKKKKIINFKKKFIGSNNPNVGKIINNIIKNF
jgi:hypothetical protein